MAAKATTPARLAHAAGPRNATDAALAKFQEAFTKDMGTAFVQAPKTVVKSVSTGSLMLDAMIGTGGWPIGRIVEVWGPEHAGKTTMAMLAAAEYQRADPKRHVAWIDMEQTFDSTWAETLGVDLNRLSLYIPLTAEDVADAARRFIQSGFYSLVVLDSVGGMISRMEYEKEADEATVAQVPRIVTRMVKQAAPLGAKNETTVMVINQVRAVIGGYGPTESTGGGWALKHVTSLKIQVKRGEPVKGKVLGEQVTIGHQVVCRIEKNKINGRAGRAQFLLISQPVGDYTEAGVDKVTETFDVAQKFGALPRGAWITLPDGERVNGRAKAIPYLEEHPETVAMIRESVMGLVKTGEIEPEAEDGSDQISDADLEGV